MMKIQEKLTRKTEFKTEKQNFSISIFTSSFILTSSRSTATETFSYKPLCFPSNPLGTESVATPPHSLRVSVGSGASSRMNVPLSLSIALVLLSCYGNVSSDDEEEATTQPSYTESTTDPDYDYNSTFEYYYVTNNSSYSDSDEISPESTTPMLDVRRIVFVSDSSSCRSITDRSLLTSSLLLSLAALFH